MEEVLRYVLEGVAVGSLAAVALYVLGFVSVVVATLVAAHGDDPASEELDRCLTELLGAEAVGAPRASSRHRSERRYEGRP